jgi:lysophospholipase L1-like esterase
VRIILSTIVDNNDPVMHGKILTYNAGLPSVVASENSAGGHVDLIDNYTAVGLYSVVNFFDGTHPNHVGYALMVPVWQAAIDYRIQHWV